MKKMMLAVAALAALLLASCSSSVDYDAVDTPEVKLYALPGVNVLTIKDTGKNFKYDVWRTVADGIEDKIFTNYSAGSMADDNIYLQGTTYSYRIVAKKSIPTTTTSDYLVDRVAETVVSMTTPVVAEDPEDLKGTFAPYGTEFLDLAKYEADYDEDAVVLSPETITVDVDPADWSVVVTFPTKIYATYSVVYSDVGGIDVSHTEVTTPQKQLVDGLVCNGKGWVKFNSIGNNEKEIAVVATPKNRATYKPSTVTAAKKVQITCKSFTITNATAVRTDSKTVNIQFNSEKILGASIPADSFKVYRYAAYTNAKDWNDNYEYLGTAKLSAKQSANLAVMAYEENPVYYFDDTTNDIEAKDVTYSYVIVGNYNGYRAIASINNISTSDNFAYASIGSTVATLQVAQDGTNADVKATVTATYVSTKKVTVSLFKGEFPTCADAKTATLDQINTPITLGTPVQTKSLTNSKKTDGVELQTITDKYEPKLSSLEAGVTQDVTANAPNSEENKGKYYVLKFVVSDGETEIVQTKRFYFTKIVSGNNTNWTYSNF